MNKEPVISFPHLGDYHIPIKFLLTHLTKYRVIPSPPITKHTIELGQKHSPDFVCVPFKYNLGNFIETLENGATLLLQVGGGCRYGYYPEVQEKILKDLGYSFELLTIGNDGKVTIKSLYKIVKKINPSPSLLKTAYYLLLTLLMIRYMDEIDFFIRENIGFEVHKGDFEKTKKNMLSDFSECENFHSLTKCYRKYKKMFKEIEIDKPDDCLKVGIIGELYTSMEPFSSYFLERELAHMNIQIKRFTNASYLLYQKRFREKKMLKKIQKYCKYTLGADGMDNVYRAKYLIENGYDGIIHIKPFGCTPEIGAIPIIRRVCEDGHTPIIFFSFDVETSETGIKTRLEAFYDMLKIKKG